MAAAPRMELRVQPASAGAGAAAVLSLQSPAALVVEISRRPSKAPSSAPRIGEGVGKGGHASLRARNRPVFRRIPRTTSFLRCMHLDMRSRSTRSAVGGPAVMSADLYI